MRARARRTTGILATASALAVAAGAQAPAPAHGSIIDRQMKLELIDALDTPPCVVWYGSSTSREVNPRDISSFTGKPSFNASLSAGRPYEFDYFNTYFGRRFPKAHIHRVIGLDIEQFRRRREKSIYPRSPGSDPPAVSKFYPNGFRRHDPYAWVTYRARRAYVLRFYRDAYRNFPATLSARSQRFLRTMLAKAVQDGDHPTVVLMPVHPEFARTLKPYGRPLRHARLVAWLQSLQRSGLAFRIIDLSSVRAFHGSAAEFHDPVHMTPTNMHAMVRYLGTHGAFSCTAPKAQRVSVTARITRPVSARTITAYSRAQATGRRSRAHAPNPDAIAAHSFLEASALARWSALFSWPPIGQRISSS